MYYGKTEIVICDDEFDLGAKAAAAVAVTMRDLLGRQEDIRMILAGGQSQDTFLDALALHTQLDWSRVTCFNMDDFWMPGMPAALTVAGQCRRQLYDVVHPGRVCLVDASAADPQAEASRFESLLRTVGPIDILCEGIGTSGHLAFNEPGDCDFAEERWVKVVAVQETSRRQLVSDPNFAALPAIPDKGITMTIPALMSARHRFTMVPLGLKRPILTRLLQTRIPTTALPASILLEHEGKLFADRNSWPG